MDDLVIAFGNNHAEIPDNAMFYTPKAIILLADEPLFSTQRRILFSMASAGGAALHAWARLLTSNELPLPAPGKAVSFTMSGCPIEVAVPAHDDFPQLDVFFLTLFFFYFCNEFLCLYSSPSPVCSICCRSETLST